MPVPLDRLFGLTVRDQLTVPWAPLWSTNTAGASATSVTVDLPATPQDQLFWLTRIFCLADPGAGQKVTVITVYVVDQGGNTISRLYYDTTDWGADNLAYAQFNCDLVVPFEYTIRAAAAYDAGVAGNTLEINGLGYKTVRGNVSP